MYVVVGSSDSVLAGFFFGAVCFACTNFTLKIDLLIAAVNIYIYIYLYTLCTNYI